jgi:hypothetical protein
LATLADETVAYSSYSARPVAPPDTMGPKPSASVSVPSATASAPPVIVVATSDA